MNDWTLAACSLAALAGAGVLVGSIGWEWYDTGPPSLLTFGIRAVVAVGCHAAGLMFWAATSWSSNETTSTQ